MGQDISASGCSCSCARNDEIAMNTLTASRHATAGYDTAGAGSAPSSRPLFPGSTASCANEGQTLKLEQAGLRISTSSTQLASNASNASPETEKRHSHVSVASLQGSTNSASSLDRVSECSSRDSEYESGSPKAASISDCDSEGAVSASASEVIVRPRMARRRAICAGTLQKHVFQPPVHNKDEATISVLMKAVESCSLFKNMLSHREMEDLVNAFSTVNVAAGTRIVEQGADGDAMFAVLKGGVDCFLERSEPLRPRRPSNASQISSASNGSNASNGSDMSQLSHPRVRRHSFITAREAGSLFGEVSVICSLPRSLSVYARSDCSLACLERDVYQTLVVQSQYRKRERRQDCLRSVKLLELLSDEDFAKLADALRVKTFAPGEIIIQQGDQGEDFFIVQSGECVATVKTYDDIQEVKRYYDGDLFGELSLLKNTKRAATITATAHVEAMYINRRSFERMLGPLSVLMKSQYIHDPRKLIADFFRPGDHRGPHGSLRQAGLDNVLERIDSGQFGDLSQAPAQKVQSSSSGGIGATSETVTQWFAVFRPTSRDAIAKMLGGFAVGKGLNVKGKSAKKNRLSGFVPFIQISDNNHKDELQKMPDDSKVEVYYKTEAARNDAFRHLVKIRDCENNEIHRSETSNPSMAPVRTGTNSTSISETTFNNEDCKPPEARIARVDTFLPKAYGLRFSGSLLQEAYIMRQDLTALVGWETGRSSEPAFMDMNLLAVCNSRTDPKVVLVQHDEGNSMNGHGLLIAYAEGSVKPVVSDFDAFLIASRGMEYEDLASSQATLMDWSLDRAAEILQTPGESSWTSRWLDVLKREAEQGFHPQIPKYGFGDPTSYRLIGDVISQTAGNGAVRHGAECFNYYFPQELDESYLVVWEGFPEKPWDYKSEPELRKFLIERASEGFSFPLNPVWPIRDPGWYEVWQALEHSPKSVLDAWYPPESGIATKVANLHARHPSGFERLEGEGNSTLGGTSQCGDGDVVTRGLNNQRSSIGREDASRASYMLQKSLGKNRTSGRFPRLSRMATSVSSVLRSRTSARGNRSSSAQPHRSSSTQSDDSRNSRTSNDSG